MTPRTIWILPVVREDGEAVFYLPRVVDAPDGTICAFINRWMHDDAAMKIVSSPFIFPKRSAIETPAP